MTKRTRARKNARTRKRATSIDIDNEQKTEEVEMNALETESEEISSESEEEDEEVKKSGDTAVDEMNQTNNSITSIEKGIPHKNEWDANVSDGRYRNKQRCLILCSRGVTARYRHLLEDLRTLIPHHKKDSKLDPGKSTPGGAGGVGHAVNEICDVKSCNSYLFLECKKRGQDAYLYMGYSPSGPSAKFHLANVHTMDELRMTGNCMKGSRPILTFDDSFGKLQHLKLLKALFIDTFGTPRGHPKSKPFIDRVMGFYYADNKVSLEYKTFVHLLDGILEIC